MRLKWLTAVLVFASVTVGAAAQDAAEPKLKIGDPAPALGNGKWVKGEPVSEFEVGKVYVIDFWATWDARAKEIIPRMTELQRKYADKGVIVIGQSVAENEPGKVEPFVREMGDKMEYRVVMDEPAGMEGYVIRNWLIAAGRETLPCSIIVDQEGKLAWIGHPLGVGPVLENVLDGTHDMKAARLEAAKEYQINQLQAKVVQQMRSGDVQGALDSIDQMGQVRPEMAVALPLLKFQLLGQAGRWDEAYALADRSIDAMEDASALNTLAWTIVDPKSLIPKKNLDVALKAALKADSRSEGKNPAILDTVARVYYLRGDKQKAVEYQRKAVDLTQNPEQRKTLEQRLREYEQVQ